MAVALRAQSVPVTRLEALKARHAAIDAELQEYTKSPSASDLYLTQLKKQKLQIKEQLEGLAS